MSEPISNEQFINGLNQIFREFGIKHQLPSIEEIRARNARDNARRHNRNERIVENAIGKEIRVKLDKKGNEFVRGVIVEAELTANAQAKIYLECGANKVRRGPFFVSQLPR